MQLKVRRQKAITSVIRGQSMPETGSNCRAAAATTTTTTTTKKKNKTCDKASISLLRQQSCTEMAGRLTKSTCANDSFLKRKNDIHFGQKEEESMIDDANQGEFHRADVLLRREIPEVTLGLSLSRKGTEECATTQYDDLVESYHPPDDAATVVVPHTNPNAYFGASRMHSASGSLWNREDDDDNELRRLQELRLLAGRAEGTFGMMQRQRRGMMLTPPHGAGGTSQLSELEEDEVMRLHHFRELYRRQVLHRDQLSFSLDQHYDQIQREKHLLLDLQLERRGHYASYPDDHEDPLVVLRRRERESGGGGLTTRERILLSRDRITNSTSNPACNSRGSFFSLERPTGLSMLPQLYPPFRDPYTSLRSVRPVFENPTPGAQYESTTRNHLSYEERLDIAVAAARRRKEASETFHRTQNSVLGKRSFTDDCDLLQQLEGHHGTLSGNALRNLSDQTDRPAHLPARKLPSLGRALYSSKHKNATVDTALCTGNGMDSASSTSSDDLNDGIAQLIEVYSHGGIKEAPFPLKLHAILANPAYEDIIGWLPHGKAWKIFQVSLFEKVLVPRHFRHAKYASFMRQGKNQRLYCNDDEF